VHASLAGCVELGTSTFPHLDANEAPMIGAIEGFYGPPWSWSERLAVCRGIAAAGGDTYVYAPKDDPLHRDRWRHPYPDDELARFGELVGASPVRVGFAISPGLSIDASARADREALAAKVGQVTDVGIDLVVLALDDLPFRAGLGREHGELTAWLRDRLPSPVELAMVPNHYTGCVDVPYLADLRATVPAGVAIGWTGRFVVNDAIDAGDVARWSEVMEGRAPLLWDNVPVNDVVMADRLFLGPLRGRDRAVPPTLSGYLANGGVQALASIPPIRSAVAWARGGDPIAEWDDAIGDARVLGRCVDEHGLGALLDTWASAERDAARAAALDEVDALLADAEACTDGGLGPDVAPWVDAVRAEAAVGRGAVRVLRHHRDDPARASLDAMATAVAWRQARRGTVSVFGPRDGFRPVLGQSADGDWLCSPAAFDVERNAVDRLVRAAIAALAGAT
jgi:hyaluronoglucosaminidase